MEARRKPVLTERKILDAALELLDAGGPEAASIRRIAAAVGTAPNAVYTLFPDRAAVETALVERLLGRVRTTAKGRAGAEWIVLELRRALLEHRGLIPVVLGRPPDVRLLGRLRELLAGDGLDPAWAARGSYLMVVFVLGSVAAGSDTEQYAWGLRRVLEGLGRGEK